MTQPSTAVMPIQDPETGVIAWNATQRDLIKRTFASDKVTDDEFEMFLEVSSRTGLNPFNKQIYIIPRGSGANRKATIQVGIDGYRLIAARTKEHTGTKTWFAGVDLEWKEAWSKSVHGAYPSFAKCIVERNGYPYEKVVAWDEFVQTTPVWADGPRDESGSNKPIGQKVAEMWDNMPANQLGKCAEAGALRMAFPAELSGIFVDAEEAAMERVAREEQRRIARATQVRAPDRTDRNQRSTTQQRPQNTRQAPQRPQQPAQEAPPPRNDVDENGQIIAGEAREVPADGISDSSGTEAQQPGLGEIPFADFWNSLDPRMKRLTKEDKKPTVADACKALELADSGLPALQKWYADGGSAGDEAVDLVIDRLNGQGFV